MIKRDPVKLEKYHAGYLTGSTSRLQAVMPDFENLTKDDYGVYGLCPRVSSTRLEQIFDQGITPKAFNQVWDTMGLGLWMVLFLYDNGYDRMEKISALAWRSYEVYRRYCQEKLPDERPRAMLNNSGSVDIYPVAAILTNNEDGFGVNEFCHKHGFDVTPLLLAIDAGTPVRQHVGEITVDAMREFLDRVPAAGQKVY